MTVRNMPCNIAKDRGMKCDYATNTTQIESVDGWVCRKNEDQKNIFSRAGRHTCIIGDRKKGNNVNNDPAEISISIKDEITAQFSACCAAIAMETIPNLVQSPEERDTTREETFLLVYEDFLPEKTALETSHRVGYSEDDPDLRTENKIYSSAKYNPLLTFPIKYTLFFIFLSFVASQHC